MDPIHEEILGLDSDVEEDELERRYEISTWMKATGALCREHEAKHIKDTKGNRLFPAWLMGCRPTL